jgi:hypothetical protein
MIRLSVLLLVLSTGQLWAGAWPRGTGEGFASLSHWHAVRTGNAGSGSYTALYAEYGLTPWLTFGLDAGRSVSGATKTVMFLRASVGNSGGGPMALELGLGEIAGQPVLRPGLSFGRSVEGTLGTCWLSVDTVLELDLETQAVDIKADATLGFTPRKTSGAPSDWTLMLQVQTGLVDLKHSLIVLQETGIDPAPSFMRIVPSVTYRLSNKTDLELGYYRSLTSSREAGVKLGIWTRF